MEDQYEQYRSLFKDHSFPLAMIDLDLFDENAEQILQRLQSDVTIRIASKSVRSPDLLQRILDKNDKFKGIMCYSPKEAKFLIELGFDNLLIAYPTMDRQAVENLIPEIQNGKTIYFMVDAQSHLDLINAVSNGVDVKLCLDIDMSTRHLGLYFGTYRSQITNVEKTRSFMELIQNYENLTVKGIMGYEAQIAGVSDRSPVRGRILNFIVRRLKSMSTKTIASRRQKVVELIQDMGVVLDFVNGGGTGSVESTTKEPSITEVTVGSGFFAPGLFDDYDQFKHLPSLIFGLQIVRNPTKNIYTCHGGGYIASGAVGIDKQPKPFLPKGLEYLDNEGFGEVQTPLKYSGNLDLQIGDPLFFRHAKAGELCEHFNKIYLLEDGKITGSAKTYRGLGKIFL